MQARVVGCSGYCCFFPLDGEETKKRDKKII